MRWSREEIRRSGAYHEAAHAVVIWLTVVVNSRVLDKLGRPTPQGLLRSGLLRC
jgi:hypothetical protein